MAAASGRVVSPEGVALMLVSRLISEAWLRTGGLRHPRFLALLGYDVGCCRHHQLDHVMLPQAG
ncbi:MAG: hypothetical protein ACRDRU_24190 [Pseudonocardiaceae bacterium]